MTQATTERSARWLAILLAFEAVTFLFGAAMHLGHRMALGFATVHEPRIVPATIVEALCAMVLLGAAWVVLTQRPGGQRAVRRATGLAIAGVLIGMTALAVGAGRRTELNDLYHIAILAALIATLAWVTAHRQDEVAHVV